MISILALDISSKSTGYAIIQDGKIDLDAYGLILPDKKQSEGQQLSFFASEIKRLIDLYKPTHITAEDIFCGFNKISFKVLAMFRGVALKTIYEATGQDPFSMMAVEARSALKLPIQKDKLFKAAVKRFKLKGFDFDRDNDVVDAFCLGLAYYAILIGKAKLNTKSKKRKTRKSRKKVK